MEVLQNLKVKVQDKRIRKEVILSPYQHHVLSHVLPEVDRELVHLRSKNITLEKEKKDLLKKVEHLIIDTNTQKTDQEKAAKVLQNREVLRGQLAQCKIQMEEMARKIYLQGNDLKKEHRKNEVLKQELESLKKELQFVKQQAANQRAEQQTVRDQLEHLIKDREILCGKLLDLQNDCSDLRGKINSQQSNLTRKKNENLEEKRQTQLLRLENQKLERERSFLVNEVEETKQEVRRFEEQWTERRKLEKTLSQRSFENMAAERTSIIQQKSKWKLKQMPPEYMQLELIKQAKELRRSQRLGEELKRNLQHLALQYQQSQAALKLHKEKLRAAISQRNAFQTDMERMQCEMTVVQKDKLTDKFKNWAMKRNKAMKMSCEGRFGSALPQMPCRWRPPWNPNY